MKIEESDLKAESKTSTWSPVFFGFQFRPYGIIFTIALVLYIYKTMNNRTSSFKLITPTDFKTKFYHISDKIITLRKEHPSYFCGISTLILGTLAIIAHIISGSTLVVIGLILAGFISTRYNFKIVKIPLKVDFSWADKFDSEIADEFLPEVNESNLFVLQRAGDDALVSSTGTGDDDEKSEEIPSELMIPDSIPEIDENSDSSEDDLLLKSSLVDNKEISSKNQKIKFKKGYFKKDSSISTSSSSSSDEENLSKGLNFDYVDGSGITTLQQLQKSQSTAQSTTVGNIASQLPGMMTNFVSWGIGASAGDGADGKDKITNELNSPIRTKKSSNAIESTDEESDFEFVETDEI